MTDALEVYADLVRFWSPRLDLVAPGDLARFTERHIDDSLRLVPLLEELSPGPAVDVGSGAGLPGIPLAIVHPQRLWRLIEPRTLRAAFLEEVVRTLALSCEVLRLTAEQAARDPSLGGRHLLGTARALAPLDQAFEMLAPLVVPGGVSAVFFGRSAKLPAGAEEWRSGIAIMRRPAE